MDHRLRVSLVALVALGPAAAPAGAQSDEVRVIVNASNPGRAITRKDVADLFMKRATRWSFGLAAEPVDQSLASPVRATFCRQVLGDVLPAIQKYWQQQISSGRGTPPRVKTSDDEVIAFVAATPGAVGYVGPAVALPDSVKVLRLEE
jgi:ABC-type phosphate transport system substrate-binding protein